jgi:hypothetical protein
VGCDPGRAGSRHALMRATKSIAFASTLEVLSASPDRRGGVRGRAMRRQRARPRGLRTSARAQRRDHQRRVPADRSRTSRPRLPK